MTAAPGSMLAGGVQADLLPIEDLPDEFFSDPESKTGAPRYTARLFFRRRPEDYQRTVQLLAAGLELTEVARLMRVHHRTVAAVRDAEGAKLDTYKQRVMSNLRICVEVLSGDLADEVHEMNTSQKTMTFAILTDKLAQLEEASGSGAKSDPVLGHLTHDAILSALSKLPAIEVDAVPVAMGSDAGAAAPKGAAQLGSGEAGTTRDGARPDSQSGKS